MQQHTTEWKAEPMNNDDQVYCWQIITGDPLPIDCLTESQARRIVLAVNSYQAMREALEQAIRRMEDAGDIEHEPFADLIPILRAALALSEGKAQ
jgi:hypothetical protein